MKYLVIIDNKPFYTNWFDENLAPEGEFLCIDTTIGFYTTDGLNWIEIEEDSL